MSLELLQQPIGFQNALGWLVAEVQAARMIVSRHRSSTAASSSDMSDHDAGGSDAAFVSDRLRSMLAALAVPAPASSASAHVAAALARVQAVLPRLPAGTIERPLLRRVDFSDAQLVRLTTDVVGFC